MPSYALQSQAIGAHLARRDGQLLRTDGADLCNPTAAEIEKLTGGNLPESQMIDGQGQPSFDWTDKGEMVLSADIVAADRVEWTVFQSGKVSAEFITNFATLKELFANAFARL